MTSPSITSSIKQKFVIRDNIRSIINIIEYYENHNEKELAILFVDYLWTKKAFDRLNWDFFKILQAELDLGYKFRNAIEAVYKTQKAKLVIKGQISEDWVNIEKGTRQGCPLSPLLFIMSLEVLLRTIREDKELRGTKIRKEHYKIKAYADDMVCIVENPTGNINKWLSHLENFGKVAGLKITLCL